MKTMWENGYLFANTAYKLHNILETNQDMLCRIEHESLCGNGHTADSYLGSLGRCYSSPLSLEAVGGCIWRRSCHALRDIWLSSVLGTCWCSCSLACNHNSSYLPMVEFCQGWHRVQNLSSPQEDKVASDYHAIVLTCLWRVPFFFLNLEFGCVFLFFSQLMHFSGMLMVVGFLLTLLWIYCGWTLAHFHD